jgi:hypothetical protein
MWGLTVDALSVIALRTALIARGGKRAETESRKMVNEKIAAGLALQGKLLTGQLGKTPESALTRTLAHYRPKVKANRRRLTKG